MNTQATRGNNNKPLEEYPNKQKESTSSQQSSQLLTPPANLTPPETPSSDVTTPLSKVSGRLASLRVVTPATPYALSTPPISPAMASFSSESQDLVAILDKMEEIESENNEEIQQQKVQMTELNNKLRNLLALRKKSIEDLQSKVEKIKRLREKLENAAKENQALKQELANTNENYKKASEKANATTKEKEALEAAIKDSKGEWGDKERKLLEDLNSKANLIKQLEENLALAEESRGKLQTDFNNLVRGSVDYKDEKDKLLALLKEEKEKNGDLEKDKRALEEAYNALSYQAKLLETETAELKEKVKGLENENATKSKLLSDAQKEIEKLKTEIEGLVNQDISQKKQIASLREELAKANEDFEKRLEQRVSQLRGQLNQKEEELKVLKAKLTAAENDLRASEEKFSNLKEEFDKNQSTHSRDIDDHKRRFKEHKDKADNDKNVLARNNSSLQDVIKEQEKKIKELEIGKGKVEKDLASFKQVAKSLVDKRSKRDTLEPEITEYSRLLGEGEKVEPLRKRSKTADEGETSSNVGTSSSENEYEDPEKTKKRSGSNLKKNNHPSVTAYPIRGRNEGQSSSSPIESALEKDNLAGGNAGDVGGEVHYASKKRPRPSEVSFPELPGGFTQQLSVPSLPLLIIVEEVNTEEGYIKLKNISLQPVSLEGWLIQLVSRATGAGDEDEIVEQFKFGEGNNSVVGPKAAMFLKSTTSGVQAPPNPTEILPGQVVTGKVMTGRWSDYNKLGSISCEIWSKKDAFKGYGESIYIRIIDRSGIVRWPVSNTAPTQTQESDESGDEPSDVEGEGVTSGSTTPVQTDEHREKSCVVM